MTPLLIDWRGAVAAWLSVAFVVAGCSEEVGVTTYTVENVSADRPRVAPVAAAGQAWFFKLMGPETEVQQEADAFARLMASVRFDQSGNPTWETPAGWTERRENGMRFATLVREGSEPPLELAVSALPSDNPGSDAYLKSNIDRWRGQVGLSPYAGEDWKQRAIETGEIREVDGATGRIVLVQLSGQNPAGERLTMLAAIVPRAGAAAALRTPPPRATTASDAGAPTYTAPAEWTSEPPRQFQTALWTVTDGDQKLEVSVSQSGGSMQANLDRWRGQVEGATEPVTETIMVGGVAATRVELKGTEQAIVGVIVPRGGASWFFKMMGPAALVEQERARFQAFVESVQFVE